MKNFPKSSSKKIQKISNILIKYADSKNYEFMLFGESFFNVETFSAMGSLSIFLYSAKETYEKIYNNKFTVEELLSEMGHVMRDLTSEEQLKEEIYLNSIEINKQFPLEFIKTEEGKSYFEFEPSLVNGKDVDFFMLAHFTLYALDSYVKTYQKNPALLIDGKIPLDPLFNKMFEDINANKIELKPAKTNKNSK